MITVNSELRFTTDGFANEHSDFEGITEAGDFFRVLRSAIAETRLWYKVALIQKAKSKRLAYAQDIK